MPERQQSAGSDGRPARRGGILSHPRATLAVIALILAALTILGRDVDERLSPTSLDIPGTASSRANDTLEQHFGESAPFAILLRGPAAALDRQGPRLIRALRADPAVTTLSPWDRGAVSRLRPGPDRALIIADFHVGLSDAVRDVVPHLDRTLEHQIDAPVHATQTSYATLSRSIQEDSIAAAERSELIALPILLIVLLLVFRSPVAAAIPLCFGAITVAASRGVLELLTNWFEIDAFALTVCTMMGLALGVDYALLMVSRFREELGNGLTPSEAAALTRRTAGRTTAFAGSTLMLSMVVAFFIVPGSLLASLAATVAMVVVLSVLVATVAGPALLTLLGPNVDRWRIGLAPNGSDSRLMAAVSAALRRPLPVAIAIGALVLILSAPAVALKTGPPSPTQLAEDNQARQDSELLAREAGAGFESPYVVVASTDFGPITEPQRFRTLARWQRRISAQPGVQAVIGPAPIQRAVAPVREQGRELLNPTEQLAQISRLADGLSQARSGIAEVRGGLAEAAHGAGLLADGSDQATTGAEEIARGLGRANGGIGRLVEGLERFHSGIEELTEAQEEVLFGTVQLKTGLHESIPNLRRNALSSSRDQQRSLNQASHVTLPRLQSPVAVTEAELRSTLAGLEAMTVGQGDPTYAPTLDSLRRALAAFSGADPTSGQPYAPEYAGLPAELTGIEAQLTEDAERSERITSFLVSGIQALRQLSAGADQLNVAAQRILKADRRLGRKSQLLVDEVAQAGQKLRQLSDGATRLAAGLTELEDGTETLEENLARGFSDSYPLEPGLQRAAVSVVASGKSLRRGAERLKRSTPGIFDSGYFVLSALDGATGERRERAAEGIDLDHGGQAATLLVFSEYPLNSEGSIEFNRTLNKAAAGLARDLGPGVSTGVGGGPATLNDYGRITRAGIPLVVAAITLATFLILIPILRSIPLAAIAVALNLATVGVAFGILTLLTEAPAGFPGGGHTYIDSVGATIIFGIVFGLSIDYAVFLLVRMRESYDRDGDHRAAIEFGLEKTARVITGAAAIMMAVFIAFAGASIATVSQLGIGLTVAVLLDATVVRIVLLPALMLIIGEKVWWLPKWLDRAMPRLNV